MELMEARHTDIAEVAGNLRQRFAGQNERLRAMADPQDDHED